MQRRTAFVRKLYPPKPSYKPAALLDYIQSGVDALTIAFHAAAILVTGRQF